MKTLREGRSVQRLRGRRFNPQASFQGIRTGLTDEVLSSREGAGEGNAVLSSVAVDDVTRPLVSAWVDYRLFQYRQ